MLVTKGERVSQYSMSPFSSWDFFKLAFLSEDLNFKWHEIKEDLAECVVSCDFFALINLCNIILICDIT